LKTVKAPYLCNRLTDFDEMWHGDACWSSASEVKFKFLIFDNVVWPTAAILKTEKLLKYIFNCTTTHYTILTIKQQANINIKDCSLSIVLTATDQKPPKNHYKGYITHHQIA